MGRGGRRNNHKLQSVDPSNDGIDLAALLRTTKKGTNISHLIQYDLPQHSSVYQYSQERKGGNSGGSRRRYKSTVSHLHLEGMNYINANYKFILKQNGDYNSQLIDPSIPPKETDIVRVLVNNGDYHCPICLGDDFVAPRMTKCGHIFCYPCILSLFEAVRNDPKALKNNPNLKHALSVSCPFCSNIIKEKHILLPVLIDPRPPVVKSPVVPNSDIIMTLMYKPHGSINATSMSKFLSEGIINQGLVNLPSDVNSLNWYKSDVCRYNRLILTHDKFELNCLQFEKESLKTQKFIDMETYSADGIWFDRAVEKIDQMIEAIETNDEDITESVNRLSLSPNGALHFWPPESDAFYFYEYDLPNSKQTFILSNIDTRVVRQLYLGSANAELKLISINDDSSKPTLPLELIVNVESINPEFTQVTEEMLSKLKYLGHLPMGKEVSIVEVNWNKTTYPETADISIDLLKKLQTRSKNTNSKNIYEEKERIKGEKIREKEIHKAFNSEKYVEDNEEQDLSFITKKKNKSNKALEAWGASTSNNTTPSAKQPNEVKKNFNTTVWGTHIPVIVDPEEEERLLREQNEAQQEIELAIKEAKENNKGKKGKKSKKIYLSI